VAESADRQRERGPMPSDPLTRRNEAGHLYVRPPEVEQQIWAALAGSEQGMIERAKQRDYTASDYLQQETLVYLVRHYCRMGNDTMVNELSAILIARCTKHIGGRLAILGADHLEDAACDVVASLFSVILDLTSDRADFFQVRFRPALDKLIIGVFRRYTHAKQQAHDQVPLSSFSGADGATDPEIAHHQRLPDALTMPAASLEQNLLTQEALAQLKEPHRIAFLLRYLEGWPVFSSDPSVPTISRYFKRDPRTIRLWLEEAKARLQAWQGETQ
jgi:hypothetical protein